MTLKLGSILALLALTAGSAFLLAVVTATPRSRLVLLNPPQEANPLEFNPRTVIDRPFPAITDVPFYSSKKGSESLRDDALVLGVECNGFAKAYPITQLCGPTREIINDQFGDRALAVTW